MANLKHTLHKKEGNMPIKPIKQEDTENNNLAVGAHAPAFSLHVSGYKSDKISLSELKGKNIVLYFYPKDDTPGCTSEAKDFAENIKEFEALDTIVIGISKDTLASHDKFAAKYDLPFPLAADENCEICAAYGVWKEKMNYGKKYMGIERTTFLIDKNGIIRQIWRKVKVAGHVAAVLKAVKEM